MMMFHLTVVWSVVYLIQQKLTLIGCFLSAVVEEHDGGPEEPDYGRRNDSFSKMAERYIFLEKSF